MHSVYMWYIYIYMCVCVCVCGLCELMYLSMVLCQQHLLTLRYEYLIPHIEIYQILRAKLVSKEQWYILALVSEAGIKTLKK